MEHSKGKTLFVFVIMALLLLNAIASEAAVRYRFYVAPFGNDRWSGRLPKPTPGHKDGPFATFNGALVALRKLREKGALNGAVTVYFRSGTYSITQPIIITPADSGTATESVTFSAAPNENPIISGGRTITGWRKGSSSIWYAQLPESWKGWNFQQLFINGHRRPRAHLPAAGFYRMVGPAPPLENPTTHASEVRDRTAFLYKNHDIQNWKDLYDAQVVVYHSWETSRLRIKSLDEQNHIVNFTGPSAWPFGTWERDQRYTINNLREGLTRPGEWYLDHKAGVLEYIPYRGENIRHEQVMAPVAQSLIQLEGDPKTGKLIRYLRFTGFKLEYSDWTLEPQGHSDPQAAVSVPAAIMANGAERCSIDHCDIARLGTYAVWLGRGCRYNVIQHNIIHNLGVGGVRIGEPDRPKDPAELSSHNWVDNNQIYDGGYVYPAGVGIWLAQSDYNLLSHNDIHDMNYDGISVGWNWDDTPNDTNNNVIEYNDIHRVMRGVLSDGGGIYCLGASPGSVIRCNLIHDVFPYHNPPFGWGIYLDALSSGYLVEDNIVYDTLSGGLMAHNGAHNNRVTNNIFAYSATALIWPFTPDTPNTFSRNICCVSQGDLLLSWSAPTLKTRWGNNLYFAPKRYPIQFWGRTLMERQAMGEDMGSVIANPMFVDPSKGDFRLKKDSPALKLGFHPIPVQKIGLYGEREWVKSALRFAEPPVKLPPLPPKPKPLTFQDGFEQTPVGALPKLADVIGEAKGASIRITDEMACHGKHSLKFTDQPDLAHPWEPFLYYSPHYTQGMAEMAYDIRLEQGAKALIEWRDSASPYQVGPSILLGDGHLYANGVLLMPFNDNQWYHLRIQCELGTTSNGHYEMSVTPPDAPLRKFENLPDGTSGFQSLEWLGFICPAAKHAVFYLDDLSLHLKRP